MSDLIKVMKDREVIEIHPLALADHQKLGWVIWDETAEAAAEAKAVEEKAAEDSKAATDQAVAEAKVAEVKIA